MSTSRSENRWCQGFPTRRAEAVPSDPLPQQHPRCWRFKLMHLLLARGREFFWWGASWEGQGDFWKNLVLDVSGTLGFKIGQMLLPLKQWRLPALKMQVHMWVTAVEEINGPVYIYIICVIYIYICIHIGNFYDSWQWHSFDWLSDLSGDSCRLHGHSQALKVSSWKATSLKVSGSSHFETGMRLTNFCAG